MNQDPTIVVLEDQQVRVDWLRRVVGDNARIVWCKTVLDMLAAVENHQNIKCLILDHDIPDLDDAGLTTTADLRDKNGHDGTDAVKLLPPVNTCVIVWSLNAFKADYMVAVMREKSTHAVHIPFMSANFNRLAVAIHSLL